MKVLLIGKLDLEDGGYLGPMGVEIPSSIETYQEAIEWMKDHPEVVEEIVKSQCQYVYNDELEEEVPLKFEEMTDFSYCSRLHIDFEKDEWIYEVDLSMDMINVVTTETGE